ncbi:hypothetical protein J7I97_29855, partial [Streptomyces sp. ISL-87]|nr:hypothetical protein [Streptomyces sp. ISL-21]MBT2612331.1 hypothetical protein [Streptomyces sp. ISL-87]
GPTHQADTACPHPIEKAAEAAWGEFARRVQPVFAGRAARQREPVGDEPEAPNVPDREFPASAGLADLAYKLERALEQIEELQERVERLERGNTD